MLPYGRQSIDEQDVAAVTAVLRGDWLTTGPAVDEFEEALAAAAGVAHAVSVTSGTAALHTAYAALGVGPGDEVVTTPMTFVATASTAAMLGATVVFADVEPDTGNIDPAAVAALVTERTKVIAAVDYAGHPADYPALREIADRHGVALLADAAHSIGGSLHGVPVGSLADVTTFSFFPTKNMTTAEGGAVVTSDPDLARRARTFRTIGLVRDRGRMRHPDEGPWHQEVHTFGLNYRLPDVLAALGRSQLRKLSTFKARRAAIVERYCRALQQEPQVRAPTCRPGADPMWHLCPIRVDATRRRSIFEAMRAEGIGVQVNYMPVHWHPVFADMGYTRGMCPEAERYYAREISLPLFPGLEDSDVDRCVDTLLAEVRR